MSEELPTREEALAHFGVKGMKWGVRRVRSAGGTIKREIEKDNKSIHRARAQKPAAKARYKRAKAQYKIDKQDVGRKAAVKVLRKERAKYQSVKSVASQNTTAEVVRDILITYGAITAAKAMTKSML